MSKTYLDWCHEGLALQQSGDFELACACYERARQLAPPSLELEHNLGAVYRQLGDLGAAKAALERALLIRPDTLATLDELAQCYQAQGDVPGALGCYERILTIAPRHVPAFVGMGYFFLDAGWETDAVSAFESALSFDSDNVSALNGFATCLRRMGRYQEAVVVLMRAVSMVPNDLGLKHNLAMLYGVMCDSCSEIALYREILSTTPQDGDTHFGLACALLMSGNLPEGWVEYEYRFFRTGNDALKPRESKLPQWKGGAVVYDESGLIIYAEQGFGDAIQFARYLPLVLQHFKKVMVQVKPALLELFESNFGHEVCVVTQIENELGYTHHIPMMSLALAHHTSLSQLPLTKEASGRYLVADNAQCLIWQERVRSVCTLSALKVGLVWATGKRAINKASFDVPIHALEKLFKLSGVSWFSLNKEPLNDDDYAWLLSQGVLDYTNELSNFADTAALIENLDLVISVDTAVAHLAGALGKPIWLLNRFESEWRWMRDRSDSPWYPSMRIFRQPSALQWQAVVDAVFDALSGVSGLRKQSGDA